MSASVFPSGFLPSVCSVGSFIRILVSGFRANLGNLDGSPLKTHNLSTSEKALFPNKVTLPGSRHSSTDLSVGSTISPTTAHSLRREREGRSQSILERRGNHEVRVGLLEDWRHMLHGVSRDRPYPPGYTPCAKHRAQPLG